MAYIDIYKDDKLIKSFKCKDSLIQSNHFDHLDIDTKAVEILENIHYYLTKNRFDLRFKYQKENFINTVKLYEFLLYCDKECVLSVC